MYKTPKGYDWPCDDKKCMEERDEWGDDDDYGAILHCENPQICHNISWTEKNGGPCDKCGKYFCESCLGDEKNIGRFVDEDSDIYKNDKYTDYIDNEFICYQCVPKLEPLIQEKVKVFREVLKVTPRCAKILAEKIDVLAELPELKKHPRSELLIWLVEEVQKNV